jgi:hypothetical protein
MKARIKVLAYFGITIILLGVCSVAAQTGDSLVAQSILVQRGDTGQVSIFLRNSQFAVAGFSLRLQLSDSLNAAIVDANRGQDVADFEYFLPLFTSGTCRITAVVNWPGGGNPPPLAIGYHEIARIAVSISPAAPVDFSDSLSFRSDTLPPDRDNSISDNSGYINLVPELQGARIMAVLPAATDESQEVIPGDIELGQNYPNPFNAQTSLVFRLAHQENDVRLVIFDSLGRRTRGYYWASLSSGRHEIIWDGSNDDGLYVSSGLYFYRLSASGFETDVKRMTLVK